VRSYRIKEETLSLLIQIKAKLLMGEEAARR
jgi:hypothetical protein